MTDHVSLLDHPAVSGCYLFPQPRRLKNPWLVELPGATLACYRRVIDPARLTFIHFHGNGEAVADYVPDMSDAISSLGLNALFVEYRQYGESTGNARLVEMLGDGAAVMDVAGIAPERAIVFGRSIGSLYAIELACRRPSIAGLILESSIADPSERFLKYADFSAAPFTRDAVQAEADRWFHHERKLAAYHGPLLVLHAQHDHLVDISHAERNFASCPSPHKRLVRFPLGDHNSIQYFNHDEYMKAIGDLVRSIEG